MRNDRKVLESILVCPLCKHSLSYSEKQQEFICSVDQLAFPIRDGIPVMLEQEARHIDSPE